LNLVNSTNADRAWQTWFWFNHFNVLSQKSHVGAVLRPLPTLNYCCAGCAC
jgi:hypothetical protein